MVSELKMYEGMLFYYSITVPSGGRLCQGVSVPGGSLCVLVSCQGDPLPSVNRQTPVTIVPYPILRLRAVIIYCTDEPSSSYEELVLRGPGEGEDGPAVSLQGMGGGSGLQIDQLHRGALRGGGDQTVLRRYR